MADAMDFSRSKRRSSNPFDDPFDLPIPSTTSPLTADELLQLAMNTPLPADKAKNKKKVAFDAAVKATAAADVADAVAAATGSASAAHEAERARLEALHAQRVAQLAADAANVQRRIPPPIPARPSYSGAAPRIPSRVFPGSGRNIPILQGKSTASVKAYATEEPYVSGSDRVKRMDPSICSRRAGVKAASRGIAKEYYAQAKANAQVPNVTCARTRTTAFKLGIRARPGDPPIVLAEEPICQEKHLKLAAARRVANMAVREKYQEGLATYNIPAFLRCGSKAGLGVGMRNAFRVSKYQGLGV
jgi:hypothetical protein